jgi:hypothetical protein
MSDKKEETASFVLRLNQKIFESENGQPEIQWRGNIRHVQTGEESRFSNFEAAKDFVQNKLSDLTLKAVENKSEEDQKGIISKSFDFWKKVASATPKMVLDSIKDPKKQVTNLQDQIQEQIANLGESISHKIEDRIGQKIEMDDILGSSKSDTKKILTMLNQLSEKIELLNEKVETLSKKKNAK